MRLAVTLALWLVTAGAFAQDPVEFQFYDDTGQGKADVAVWSVELGAAAIAARGEGFNNSGAGIIEIVNPNSDVCPDEGDPGCPFYGGNTVWLDPNATAEYVVTNTTNNLLDLIPYVEAINGDTFEMRFTMECATSNACLGVYGSFLPRGNDLITAVPFELWNTGDEDDPDDDVRMIPFLLPTGDAEPTAQWDDTYPVEQQVIVGENTLVRPVTQRVLWVMPDRPDGHASFDQAARAFGGAGATYDPENDGDTQVDSLSNGQECRGQQYYTDFCYRNASDIFVAPIGGLDGVVFADIAQDGTTPPVGTIIRFDVRVESPSLSVIFARAEPLVPNEGVQVVVSAAISGQPTSARLNYRAGGSTTFSSIPMTRRVAGYEATIPISAVTSRGVVYQVEAEDAGGTVVRSGLESLAVEVGGSGATSSFSLPGTGRESDYRLVSVPLDLESAGASAVLENEFGSYDNGESWRFYRILPPGQQGDAQAGGNQWYDEGPSGVSMTPGRAFWLLTSEGGRFDTGAGTTLRPAEPYEVSLHGGWNFVAAPFDFNVPVSRTRLASGDPVQLHAFDGTWRMLDGGVLEPFSGYALRVVDGLNEDTFVIESPADEGGRQAHDDVAGQAREEGDEEGWALHIHAETDASEDGNNVAMVSPAAETAHDPLDWFEPPVIGDYVSVSFDPPAGSSAPLTVDARPVPEDGVAWPLTVRTGSAGRVEMRVDGVGDVPPEFVVWLVDSASGSVKDLRRSPSHAFASHGSGRPVRFDLVVGTSEFARSHSGFDGAVPTKYGLDQNYPNPFRAVTTIPYQLPEAQHVVLTVYDVTGRLVATLVDEEQEAGYHESVWAGRAGLASGMYLYRLRAGSYEAVRRTVLLR